MQEDMATKEISKQSLEVIQEKTPEIQLIESIINVMAEVEYLQKDDTVGTGSNAYKGISDEKVKLTLRKSMITHGLICVPVSIISETKQERWTEADPYSKTGGTKTKQQIFSDIKVTFRIYHVSGSYIEGQSTGHGVDSQDKAAGKAMTYAMKIFLLNTFMIPTGDDTDKTHSIDIEIPKVLTAEINTKTVNNSKNSEYPSKEEIVKNLYNGDGIITKELFNGVLNNWQKNGAVLLYDSYIYTVTNNSKNYFALTKDNAKAIISFVKDKYNG
jgi:hypothetical protein